MASPGRILTTHVGSLPRPQSVVDVLFAQDRDEPVDEKTFEDVIRAAVEATADKQKAAGVDIISDGEMSKISYATYIRHRLTGFEPGEVPRATPADLDDYPDFRDQLVATKHSPRYKRPVCKGPITVKTLAHAKKDVARLKAAAQRTGAVGAFLTAASPGTIAVFQPNEYYPSHAAYLEALAEGMRLEYETIAESGLLVSIDCPDLGMGRHITFKNVDDEEFVRNAHLQIDALNHALQNVPATSARLHICWGNYEGPHTRDIPLEKVLPALMKAKPQQWLIEGANPRHEHEWALWETIKFPEDKIVVPGVLDTSTNYVEHPELIAQRLLRYANLVGRDRVIAGTDCGFGTFAGFGPVHPDICWLKLRALADGAKIASDKLWKRAA